MIFYAYLLVYIYEDFSRAEVGKLWPTGQLPVFVNTAVMKHPCPFVYVIVNDYFWPTVPELRSWRPFDPQR